MSKNIIGTTTSNFQYRLESDIDKKLGTLSENMLDFKTQFEKGDLKYKELEMIARNLESTAQYFGEQYGLGGSRLLEPENLIAEVNHYNDSIIFENRAQDDYKRFYAGFVEYGHRTKSGYVPARPFMRNALYTVAKASTNQIGEALGDLLSNIFSNNGEGYQGIHKLNFGKGLGESYFFRKSNDKVVSGFRSALSQRQRGRTNKEFGEYKITSTVRKQASLTRGNKLTDRKRALSSSFSKLNSDAKVDSKLKKEEKPTSSEKTGRQRKGVRRRNYGKRGPKGVKPSKEEVIDGFTYTLPSFFDD